jgi:hypothetical protein
MEFFFRFLKDWQSPVEPTLKNILVISALLLDNLFKQFWFLFPF